MEISTLYGYYWARYLEGFKSEHVAALNQFRAIQAMGNCLDTDWVAQDDLAPTDKELQYSVQRRVWMPTVYLHLNSIDEIKEVLVHGEIPVPCVIPVYESFCEASAYGLVPIPSESEEVIEKHCVSICGYNSQTMMESPAGNIMGDGFFTFLNSYGQEWGDEGCGYFSFEFFNRFAYEAWAYMPIERARFNRSLKHKFTYKLKQGKVYCRLYQDATGLSWGKKITLLFAYYNEQPIGWLTALERIDEKVEILDFFVWPVFRGQGLGDALLSYFIDLYSGKSHQIFGWLNHCDSLWDGTLIIAEHYEEYGFSFYPDENTLRWSKGLFVHTV